MKVYVRGACCALIAIGTVSVADANTILPDIVVIGSRSDEIFSADVQPLGPNVDSMRPRLRDLLKPDPGQEGAKCSSDSPKTEGPVNIRTGNKTLYEVDLALSGNEMPLVFERTYSLAADVYGSFGRKWTSSVDYRLGFKRGHLACISEGTQWPPEACTNPMSQPITQVFAKRPDQSQFTFLDSGETSLPPGVVKKWKSKKPDSIANIYEYSDKWELHQEDGGVESYKLNGQPVSILNRYGVGWYFDYAAFEYGERVTKLRHTSGKELAFTYDLSRIKSVTDPNGNFIVYDYDSAGRLATATFPGGTGTRTYHYELGPESDAVTGISVDGVRFSTYAYHPDGRVQMSTRGESEGKLTFVYGTDYTEVTNAAGSMSRYSYAEVGPAMPIPREKKLVSVSRSGISDCANASSATAYDANGFIDYEIDWAGLKTDYTYNARGQLLNVTTGISTNPAISSRLGYAAYTWTDDNRVATEITYSAPGGTPIRKVANTYYLDTEAAPKRLRYVKTTGYDALGQVLETRTTIVTYTFHPSGLVATRRVNGPLAGGQDAITYSYDTSGNLVSVGNGLGHVTAYANFTANGKARTVTDPNGNVTTFDFDARSRATLTSRTISGQTATRTYQYNALGGVVAEFFNGTQTWKRTFGPTGKLYHERLAVNTDDFKAYTYDAFSNLTKRQVLQLVYVTDVQCLEAGGTAESCRIVAPDPAVKFTRSWAYDEIGRLKSEVGNNGQNIRYLYDDNSNVKTITDSLGRITANVYDARNRLIKSTNPLGQITEFDYDAAGNLIWVKDPKDVDTTYTYNGFGELTEIISQDTGTTRFQYDSAGRRTKMIRNDLSETSYAYDPLDRVTSVAAGGQVEAFVYDNCANGKGRLCSLANASGATSYTYTSDGQLDTQVATINGATYTVDWDYDLRARMTRVQHQYGSSATAVDYAYNDEDEVTGVTATVNGGAAQTLASGLIYVPFGPRTKLIYGNGAVRNQTYDLDLRLKTIATTGIQSLTYTLNANDLITKITNGIDSTVTQTFGYDELSRLKSLTATAGNQTWTFDGNGNRETHAWGGLSDDYVPDPTSNKLPTVLGTRGKTFAHDALGNVTNRVGYGGNQTYAHDAFNRLASVTASSTTSYAYNPLNQRVRKTGAGASFNYLHSPGGQLLAESANGSNTFGTIYVWLGGEPIALIRGTTIYYVHADHLARPEVLTDQAKLPQWRARNLAFDRTVTTNNIGGVNLGFPGQYYDAESSLYYNWNRYYDSSTGRYLQSDPIGLLGGFNTYVYALNNPLQYIDITGEGPYLAGSCIAYSLYEGYQTVSDLNAFAEKGREIADQTRQLEASCPVEKRTQEQQDKIDSLRQQGIAHAQAFTAAQMWAGMKGMAGFVACGVAASPFLP